jgi:RHS repeat-associated protein
MPLWEINFDPDNFITQTFYIYGPQGLIAIEQGAQRLFALKDHLGSIRLLIDSSQRVKAAFDYGPLGNTISAYIDSSVRNIVLHYRYTGQEWEGELGGLYNFRARFYDPSTGRFLTPDPLMQNPNTYEYAYNNPINYLDPTGTWSWSDVAAVGAGIVGGAIAIVTLPATLPAVGVGLLAVGAGALAGGLTEGSIEAARGNGFEGGFVRGVGFGAAGGLMAVAGSAFLGGGFFASTGLDYLAGIAAEGEELEMAGLVEGGVERGLGNLVELEQGRVDIMLDYAGRGLFPGMQAGVRAMFGIGMLSTVGALAKGLLHGWQAPNPTSPALTNLQASEDGIQCCELLDAVKLGLPTNRNIQGGYAAIVDLTRAQPFINDGSYRCSGLSCTLDSLPRDSRTRYKVYSQHILHPLLAKDRPWSYKEFKYIYDPWSTIFPDQTLYINGGFFYPYVDSYREECTDVQGIWVANNQIVSADYNKAYWAFKGESPEKYNLDALVFYQHPEDNGGKYAECIAYDSTRFFGGSFLRKVKIALSGVFFVRDSADYSDQLPDSIIARSERYGRTGIGVSPDGKKLYILQVSNDFSNAPNGITFNEAAHWFLKQGCRTAVMLDGSASSQLYYHKNEKEFQSYPMERLVPQQTDPCNQRSITSEMQQFRPVHQFLGFK